MNWQNVTVKLSDLQPWEHNPRTMTKKQAQRLLKSWQDLGQFQTIAIGPRENGSGCPVYDGHQRLSALMAAYGAQYAIDARQSDRPLTEDERRYLITQANLPVGAWNFETIAGWPEAQEWGFDAEMLKTWNSDAAALATMLAAEQQGDADAEPQIDRAAELNEKWQVQRGDLWRIGAHRLLCGDSTKREDVERVTEGERVKFGFHDPPYGIDVVGLTSTDGASKPYGTGRIGFDGVVKANAYSPVIGDDKPFDPKYIMELSEFCILWGANYYADKLPPMKGWLVWDKKGRDDWRDTFSDCELAWSNLKTVTRIFRHTWLGMVQEGEREKRVHPTQKPAALYQKIMSDLFKEDGDVADYYAGGCPTMVACQNLQRKCRAIEISPNYCAVILERMATAFPGIEIERISEAVLTHGT